MALALLLYIASMAMGTQTKLQEKRMNTQISSKFAAFAVALMMNSLIIGSVAYLFDGRIQTRDTAASLDRVQAPAAHAAA